MGNKDMSVKLTSKWRKSLLNCVIGFVVFFIVITVAYAYNYGQKVQVYLKVSTEKDNAFRVYFTSPDSREFNDNYMVSSNIKGGEEKVLNYCVPHNIVNKLRIDFNSNPGTVKIKSLTIESALKKVVLQPQEIKEKFNTVSKDVDEIYISDNALNVKSTNTNPYIVCDTFMDVINSGSWRYKKVALIGLISLILSIANLHLIRSINRRSMNCKEWYFAFIFMLIIFLPLITKALGVKDIRSMEQRSLFEKPQFSLNKETIYNYPGNYEKYYNDNYGLKNTLIKLNSYLNIKIFRTSPTDRVVLGKDDWLFFAKEGDKNLIEEYRGNKLYTEEQLKTIKENMEKMKASLEAKGIPLIIVVAPNKETVYGEYMPSNIKKSSNSTKLDQVISYLSKNSDIKITDLRQALINNKSNEELLYHKTDTHWTKYGAYFGYKEIMKEVNKKFKDLNYIDLSEFNVEKEKSKDGGDLARMVSMERGFEDVYYNIYPKSEDDSKWKVSMDKDYASMLSQGVITENEDQSLPRLLMFRDSFTINLIPYLSQHFSLATYQWSPLYSEDLVEKVKPDIVMYEVVERYLDNMLLSD